MYKINSKPSQGNTGISFEKRILRELDSLQNQVKRLKGEVYYLKYGISREEEFYKKLIDSKAAVQLVMTSGEVFDIVVIEHLRYCLIIRGGGKSWFLQKSCIKYIQF